MSQEKLDHFESFPRSQKTRLDRKSGLMSSIGPIAQETDLSGSVIGLHGAHATCIELPESVDTPLPELRSELDRNLS